MGLSEPQKMSTSRHKLSEIVTYLSSQLTHGWSALWVAEQIARADRASELLSAQSLFSAAYEACVESAILALARLAIAHRSSMSVDYLLNCIYHSPSAYPVPKRAAVAEAVAQHRALLEDLRPLVDRVKDYRDRAIAHLDKRHVNQRDEVHAHPPVELWEIDRAFELMRVILKAHREYLGMPALYLARTRARLLEDWAYLLGLIQAGGRRL
jgi:hypothetical protein